MPHKSDLLQNRLIVFGASACELSRRFPRDIAGQTLARQLVRCATSPAANYAEAREAESTIDYVHKMKICLKELRETAAWIAMAERTTSGGLQTKKLYAECGELTAIFITCIKKARSQL